jgi:hypothetical protein
MPVKNFIIYVFNFVDVFCKKFWKNQKKWPNA